MFVDPAEPENTYRLTYSCVDCPDNARTYNDGYHVMHHLNSQVGQGQRVQGGGGGRGVGLGDSAGAFS